MQTKRVILLSAMMAGLFALLTFGSALLARPAHAAPGDRYRITRWTDVYDGPGGARIAGLGLAPDTEVAWEADTPYWVQVAWDDHNGWVPADALAPVSATPPAADAPTVSRWTNLFDAPDGTPLPVGLAPGTAVTVIGRSADGHWVQVTSAAGDGWLPANALDGLAIVTPAETDTAPPATPPDDYYLSGWAGYVYFWAPDSWLDLPGRRPMQLFYTNREISGTNRASFVVAPIVPYAGDPAAALLGHTRILTELRSGGSDAAVTLTTVNGQPAAQTTGHHTYDGATYRARRYVITAHNAAVYVELVDGPDASADDRARLDIMRDSIAVQARLLPPPDLRPGQPPPAGFVHYRMGELGLEFDLPADWTYVAEGDYLAFQAPGTAEYAETVAVMPGIMQMCGELSLEWCSYGLLNWMFAMGGMYGQLDLIPDVMTATVGSTTYARALFRYVDADPAYIDDSGPEPVFRSEVTGTVNLVFAQALRGATGDVFATAVFSDTLLRPTVERILDSIVVTPVRFEPAGTVTPLVSGTVYRDEWPDETRRDFALQVPAHSTAYILVHLSQDPYLREDATSYVEIIAFDADSGLIGSRNSGGTSSQSSMAVRRIESDESPLDLRLGITPHYRDPEAQSPQIADYMALVLPQSADLVLAEYSGTLDPGESIPHVVNYAAGLPLNVMAMVDNSDARVSLVDSNTLALFKEHLRSGLAWIVPADAAGTVTATISVQPYGDPVTYQLLVVRPATIEAQVAAPAVPTFAGWTLRRRGTFERLFTVDNSGTIWTERGGATAGHGSGLVVPGFVESLDDMTSVASAPDGAVWFAFENGTIAHRMAAGQLRQYTLLPPDSPYKVPVIWFDRSGALWIALRAHVALGNEDGHVGRAVIDERSGTYTVDQPQNVRLERVFVDNAGNVFGVDWRVIYRQLPDGEWNLVADYSGREEVGAEPVWPARLLSVDAYNGVIWGVFASDEGFALAPITGDDADERTIISGPRVDLKGSVPNLRFDDAGNRWLAAKGFVARIAPNNVCYIYDSNNSPLRGNFFHSSAIVVGQDNRIYLKSETGLFVLDPTLAPADPCDSVP